MYIRLCVLLQFSTEYCPPLSVIPSKHPPQYKPSCFTRVASLRPVWKAILRTFIVYPRYLFMTTRQEVRMLLAHVLASAEKVLRCARAPSLVMMNSRRDSISSGYELERKESALSSNTDCIIHKHRLRNCRPVSTPCCR